MRDMACQGPYFSPLLLNAMFFVASKHVAEPNRQCHVIDNCAEGRQFRRKVEEAFRVSDTQLLCKGKITTIQAFLIMSDALFSWCDERSLSWHYLGIAINMIIDLGIHTEISTLSRARSRHPEDLEVQRRLFWAAFGTSYPIEFRIDSNAGSLIVLDKVQSIYQGRPARLREMDNQVKILFLDDYEELEQFNTLSYSAQPAQLAYPTHSVSAFEYMCKLSIIADRILYNLYSENSFSKTPEELFRVSSSLYTNLKRWRDSLPAYLSCQSDEFGSFPVLPHTLSLL